MKYEKLIKWLRSHAELDREYNGSGKLFEDAADAIEALEEKAMALAETLYVYEHPWIPVTVRLPDSGDKVIVAIRDESGDTKYDYTYSGWYSGYENRWIVDDEYCSWVTYWMPLPEPPKEET